MSSLDTRISRLHLKESETLKQVQSDQEEDGVISVLNHVQDGNDTIHFCSENKCLGLYANAKIT